MPRARQDSNRTMSIDRTAGKSRRAVGLVATAHGRRSAREVRRLACDLVEDRDPVGRLARAARIIGNRIEHADVEIGKDDGQFLGGKDLASPGLARLTTSRTGRYAGR